jgi:phosphoglycerol transferase MdoB-like AlkP superfamily enzyme
VIPEVNSQTMKLNINPVLKLLLVILLVLSTYYILIELIYSLYIIPQELTSKRVRIRSFARILETAILGYAFLLFYLVSKRKLFSFATVVLFYVVFITSSVVKITYLNNPIFPVDFKQVDDLIRTKEVFLQFLPMILISLFFIFFIARIMYVWSKKERRFWAREILLIILLTSPVIFITLQPVTVESFLREKKVFLRKNADQVKLSIQSGMLNYFMQSLFLTGNYKEPPGYNKHRIVSIIQQYNLANVTNTNTESAPANIIVLLVESLTDPYELGWKTTFDPLENFRNYREKYHKYSLLSPVLGGKSINAEFEALTGLSCVFTPPSSLPFREAVSSNIPSIPNQLKPHNYKSTAIQQVKMNGFGYERIFNYLGFDEVISMKQYTGIEKDHLNRYSSVDALFKEVIRVSEASQKSFVYAFSNTTHSPWHEDHFPNTKLKLITTENVSKRVQQSINGYINAINDFDLALKQLIEHFEKKSEKTLIIVAGDHQPHMSSYRKMHASDDGTYTNQVLNEYTVPMLIWSNYSLEPPKEKIYSMNKLPALLFSIINIEPEGMIQLTLKLKNSIPVFGKIMTEGNVLVKNDETRYSQLVLDYELLQYDILYGNNYYQEYFELSKKD